MKTKKTTGSKKPTRMRAVKKTEKVSTGKTTTVFMNGESEAVRIPKEFRLGTKKVYIKKSGNCIMLIPLDNPWAPFFEALSEFSGDFMKDGREILPDQERDWSGFK